MTHSRQTTSCAEWLRQLIGITNERMLSGVTIFYFRVPFGETLSLSPDLAPLVTVLWIVGMVRRRT